MSRTATARTAIGADRPTTAGILALVQAIERHDTGSPAVAAFRSALARKGREAAAAGGLAALDELLSAVADADPERAESRAAILRAAWAGLLPGPGGRVRP